MNPQQFSRLVAFLLFIFPSTLSAEENFLLINGVTDEVVKTFGPNVNKSFTPGSTFKIVLSLIGFDTGILVDEQTPSWNYLEGFDDFLELWKAPQTPQSWMRNSCVWYSRLLALQLGLEKIQSYLDALQYGNQDMSGGLTQAWLSSSLGISPKEQVDFIQKMVLGKLPISNYSIQMTKRILFIEELPEGWKLFGKTAVGYIDTNLRVGWFVGWIEKENQFYPFAYTICEEKINYAQRIPRVKELLAEHIPKNTQNLVFDNVGSR